MNSALHILHLEDNAGDAELIQDIFETDGIVSQITRVETQADFLTSLEQGCFDLILADYSLPSFDGLSALKLAQEKCPNIPFIFVSATLGEEVAIEALKLGATDYVLKDRLSRITPAAQRALREAEERNQRKRAEEELRERERRYRYIFQATGVSIWEEDFSQVKAAIDELTERGVQDFRQYMAKHPEFVQQAISTVKVVDVNDATISLFEAGSKHDLLVSLDRIFLPQTKEVFAGELIAIAEGRPSFESETVLQTLKGDKLTVLFTVTFPPEPARFDSVLVSIIDITERKRVESEVWRLQLEMGRVERLATLGKMTGTIAHELGTPLNSVLGYTQLLAGENLPEAARRRVAVIESQIHRMVDIIQHYLSQSRGSAPKMRIHVNDLIRETLVLLQPVLQQHGIEIRTDLAEAAPALFGDRVSLQRVLTNLIDNAVDANAGKGPIHIKTVVSPSSAGKAPGIIIEVADNGAGISAEILPKIFDLFVTTKPPGKGTGLGLAICQEIIKAHGGTIKISSQVSQGTTVQIFLPTDGKSESIIEQRA